MPYKDPEKGRQYRKAHRSRPEVKEARNIRERRRHAERKASDPEYTRQKRSHRLNYEYGITLEDYERRYSEVKGCCQICGKHEEQLVVDHCHKTGIVRGLLCKWCNSGLGNFKDNSEALSNAVQYLKLGVI